MAYKHDLRLAAHRHYDDGRGLLERKRYDNAGYHFGLAAECAVKRKLLDSGVLEMDVAIWAHWPTLKTLASLAISGRQAAPLRTLLANSTFMQGWEIGMRYSGNGKVSKKRADSWGVDANNTLGLL